MGFFSNLLGRLYPQSLIARFTLIISVPMVVCQLIAVYIFYDRHLYNITLQTSKIVANQVGLVLNEYRRGDLTNVVKYSKLFDFRFEKISSQPRLTYKDTRLELEILNGVFKKEIDNFVYLKYDANNNKIYILVKNQDNSYLKITIPSKPLVNPTSEIFVFWIIGISIIFLFVAMIFAKNQIRSIEELSNAANTYGSGEGNKLKFKPSGAAEIRKAGIAFIKMQERLERQIKKRLQMLAIISHDLRTPLTRMMLQLELSEDTKENQMLKNDAESMKHMIDSYLDFARGEEGEKFIKIDIKKWVEDFFEHSRFKKTKLIILGDEIIAEIKPLSLMRAFSNIISNAEKYSTKSVFKCYLKDSKIIFELEDDGPGIKDDEKELVFKAFYRSDKARRIDKHGSVGLGLPIAKEIIMSHKGQIKIEDGKELGGVRVVISIPSC